VVTNDAKTDDKLRLLRNYGQRKKYHHDEIGYNHRLDSIQAAVLRVKLKYLDEWNAARRKNAETYTRLLAGLGVHPPVVPDYSEPIWHLYVIRVEDRDGLQDYLAERNIDTGIHYPIPIHLQPAYQHLGYKAGDFPVTEGYADHLVSLPMYAELTDEMIEAVVEAIKAFL
jgi:dTDP-4-amino-4,6-dideoxygalactose transaminase